VSARLLGPISGPGRDIILIVLNLDRAKYVSRRAITRLLGTSRGHWYVTYFHTPSFVKDPSDFSSLGGYTAYFVRG